MTDIRARVNAQSDRFGIEVVDVRLRRADLPGLLQHVAHATIGEGGEQNAEDHEGRKDESGPAQFSTDIRHRHEQQQQEDDDFNITHEAREQSACAQDRGSTADLATHPAPLVKWVIGSYDPGVNGFLCYLR